MSLNQTTPPAAEPITLAEVKAHLRIDHADEDALLGSYIKAARTWGELRLRRQLITAGWTLGLDAFPPDGVIRLPRPPLQSVQSIIHLDAEGDEQTLDPALYRIDAAGEPGRIVREYGATWPATWPVPEAVTIAYTAGFGDAPADVPEDYRLGLLYLVGHYYKLREPVITGTIVTDVPLTVQSLLSNPHFEFA
ncbi:MAG: phage head-tail connector protein [Pirellulales bacterium]|nr:phage head-tail connector protein [Pirellulales bacterium]